MERWGIFPMTARSSLEMLAASFSPSRSDDAPPSFSYLSRITFSALVTATKPRTSFDVRWLFIFCAFGFLTRLLLWAAFCASSISNCISPFIWEADGSGRTHVGSKSCIFCMLGIMEDFNPDGARIIKLCAKEGLSGSFNEKYRSR